MKKYVCLIRLPVHVVSGTNAYTVDFVVTARRTTQTILTEYDTESEIVLVERLDSAKFDNLRVKILEALGCTFSTYGGDQRTFQGDPWKIRTVKSGIRVLFASSPRQSRTEKDPRPFESFW